MAAPALNGEVASQILFGTDGAFARFAKNLKSSAADCNTETARVRKIADNVISFFRAGHGTIYDIDQVKTWVTGICRNAHIELRPHLLNQDSEIKRWANAALNSQKIDQKVCTTFTRVFNQSVCQQIEMFGRTITPLDPEESEWVGVEGNEELIQCIEEEIVMLGNPMIKPEDWAFLVDGIKREPSLLLRS